MKKKFKLILHSLFIVVILLAACEDDYDKYKIYEVTNLTVTVTDQEGTAVSGYVTRLFNSEKPDAQIGNLFVTDTKGQVTFKDKVLGHYIIRVYSTEEDSTILSCEEIDLTKENNSLQLEVYREFKTYDFIFTVLDMDDVSIEGRKVEIYKSGTSVLLQDATSDQEGKAVFNELREGSYTVYIYGENGQTVVANKVITVKDDTINEDKINISRHPETIIFPHNTAIVITGFMSDPKGSDSPSVGSKSGDGFVHPGQYEYAQFMALEDIDFSVNNYSVVFTNSGTPTQYGWADGVYNTTSTKVYQFNLTSGSVKKGEFFYVGGYSRMIASYYKLLGSYVVSEDKWWAVNYGTTAGGNGNGAAKGTGGLMGNASSNLKDAPDGIAVFEGTDVNENSIPADAIFYATSIKNGFPVTYQICDNDLYSRESTGVEQPYFNTGTNTFIFPVPASDKGEFIMLGGRVVPGGWTQQRTGTGILMNLLDNPDASLTDIENNANSTFFVNQ